MQKNTLKKIIGNNIRKQREKRSMSMEELAELLGLSPGFVGLIERGQRGATPVNLYKLSQIFGISLDSLFYDDTSKCSKSNKIKEINLLDARRSKISSLLHDLNVEELDFIVLLIKALKEFRGSNNFNLTEELIEEYKETLINEPSGNEGDDFHY